MRLAFYSDHPDYHPGEEFFLSSLSVTHRSFVGAERQKSDGVSCWLVAR